MSTAKDDKPNKADIPDNPSEPQVIPVKALLGPRGEALLDHQGEIYRLRTTSRGRLILTK